MADSESGVLKRKKIGKGIKRIVIIVIAVIAFIIIICAAWKQNLLKITSGKLDKNKVEYILVSNTNLNKAMIL